MSSPVTRIRDHATQMPRAIALRDKDLGIWREWTTRINSSGNPAAAVINSFPAVQKSKLPV